VFCPHSSQSSQRGPRPTHAVALVRFEHAAMQSLRL